MQLSGRDQERVDRGRPVVPGLGQGVQLPEQMRSLPAEDPSQRVLVAGGAGLGLAGASEFTGQHPAGLYLIAVAAVAAGVVVTACAALLPAQALRRLPAAHLLAEE